MTEILGKRKSTLFFNGPRDRAAREVKAMGGKVVVEVMVGIAVAGVAILVALWASSGDGGQIAGPVDEPTDAGTGDEDTGTDAGVPPS